MPQAHAFENVNSILILQRDQREQPTENESDRPGTLACLAAREIVLLKKLVPCALWSGALWRLPGRKTTELSLNAYVLVVGEPSGVV